MKIHLLTLAHLELVRERPGMFYTDQDLAALENQLHGFDAALSATGALADRGRFNAVFTSFVTGRTGISGSQGWAAGLLSAYGRTPEAEAQFWHLLDAFLSENGTS